MKDKVQKILSEIATRKLCTMDEHMAFYNDKAKEDYRFLSEIEEIIKASQEEPKKCIYALDDFNDEDRKVTCYGCEENCKYAQKEEPVSEDLEKEIDRWSKEQYYNESEKRSFAVVARHFAEWQKQKDKKGLELLKEWFEDIAEKCEHLTSGNVSHNGKMIRGFARNCAEYIKTDLLQNE